MPHSNRTTEILPQDLREFLASGKQLEYHVEACDVGRVTLATVAQIRLSLFTMDCNDLEFADEDPNKDGEGSYFVEGVDLIQTSDGGYGDEGLLIWLPLDKRYAAWDNSHNQIHAFAADTTWSDIVSSPVRYLNAQWESGEDASVCFLKPWLHHPYNREQTFQKIAYPAEWICAEQTLRGEYTDGVRTRSARKIVVDLKADSDGVFTLKASVQQMDENSKWQVDQELGRTLSNDELSDLRSNMEIHFWNAMDVETDLGETLIIWGIDAFRDKQYSSICRFYSDQPNRDSIVELGEWILKLAGVAPLENTLD
jgi:hypothetical protein